MSQTGRSREGWFVKKNEPAEKVRHFGRHLVIALKIEVDEVEDGG